ncbi:MAG TPA: T9SS type A sorting domain-containing protein [candidate division WOR-3 bacterium]|uniref:T9SS type A sorting domain-containing protein n=1 Tax=candidate division WOR-3 bacterium TaxID=2052148 RepID=A0A9C9JZD9_UNCW3|nr:T9SS type A sorting domain-containing protein [candidate division WOR-3 bacterium]
MAVSKTTNSGATWIRYDLATGSGITNAVAIDPTNSNIVYAGGDESSSVAIYKTTNGGNSWSKLPCTGLSGTTVYSLAIDPDNTNIIYAGTSINCYKSTDGGNTWSSTACPGGQTNAVIVNRGSAIYEGVYAGTESNGVYWSTDGGSSWTQINEGLTDLEINCLGVSQSTYLYAGTQNGGIHRWSIQVGADEKQENRISKELFYIMPNPAQGRATITYQLSRERVVTLSIYDIQGRLIKELVRTTQSPGIHKIQWNGENNEGRKQSAGIYFARLTLGNTSYIQKLVLIK